MVIIDRILTYVSECASGMERAAIIHSREHVTMNKTCVCLSIRIYDPILICLVWSRDFVDHRR